MRIYIASSWKNSKICVEVAKYLRSEGHVVDCFADVSTGRYVFHFSEIGAHDSLNAITFLRDERSQRAFKEDRRWLDWCECCLLILPAGRSSHLEAGYAAGKGKKLIILGEFPVGEFDVMYGFADELITWDDWFARPINHRLR